MPNTDGSDSEWKFDYPQLPCNCVEEYRLVIHFRQALFDTLQEPSKISDVQAIAMFITFYIDATEGVMKLLGKDKKIGKSEQPNADFLWKSLGRLQLKPSRGRPMRSDKSVLVLYAFALSFCPNAYVHLLRDALTLRKQEYSLGTSHASSHLEQWRRFWKAKRAVEVSCERIWKTVNNHAPEQSPEDWWIRVARQQGLMG